MTRSRVRWWTLRIGAAAALGVATTVAVAWGLAAWGRFGGAAYSMATMMPSGGQVWMFAEDQGFGMRRARSHLLADMPVPKRFAAEMDRGPRVVRMRATERRDWLRSRGILANATSSLHTWVDDACGWPMIALSCEMRTIAPVYMGTQRVEEVRWGVPLTGLGAMRVSRPRMWALPLRPVWPGFAVDAGVFGAGWCVLLVGPGVVRVWRRKRSGLCVGCGYDLEGQREGGCPECGWGREGVA